MPVRRMGPDAWSSRPSHRLRRADPPRPAGRKAARTREPDLPGNRRRRWEGCCAFGRSSRSRVLDVEALVVVDSDLRSITPEWMELLPGPSSSRATTTCAVLRAVQVRRDDHEQHHVSADTGAVRTSHPPAYRRRLRGERRPRRHYLTRDVWRATSPVRHRHLDDDLGDFRGFGVCQSRLGAKVHDAKDPGTDLARSSPGSSGRSAAGEQIPDTGWTSRAATTCPPTGSSGSSIRRSSR